MMPVSAWLGAVWPRAGCRVTPIKLSCDPPAGDYDETGAIRGWGHRAGSVTQCPVTDGWVVIGCILIAVVTYCRTPSIGPPSADSLTCSAGTRAVLPNIGDSEAADRL